MIRVLGISWSTTVTCERLTFTNERCHVLQHRPQIFILLQQVSDEKRHKINPFLFVT